MQDIKTLAKMNPSERLSESGNSIYESELRFSGGDKVHQMLREPNTLGHWHEELSFGDCIYRVVWVNLYERRILTYCEGDLTMVEATNAQAFYRELDACAKYYLSN